MDLPIMVPTKTEAGLCRDKPDISSPSIDTLLNPESWPKMSNCR